MLDLGSGSGILAIAAVKLGAARAVGIENDAEANLVAARNAERNEVAGAVEFLDGDAGDLAPLLGPADLAPLQHPPPREHRAPAGDRVAPSGPAASPIFSGMEARRRRSSGPPLAAAGLTVRGRGDVTAGWWAVAAART